MINKGLISNIYKQLIQLNIKKKKLKMGKKLNRYFLKEEIQQTQHRKFKGQHNHQANANKNCNEISPYTLHHRMAIIKRNTHTHTHTHTQKQVTQDGEKRNTYTLLMGM